MNKGAVTRYNFCRKQGKHWIRKLHRVIAPLVSMYANYSVLKYRYETIFKKYYIVSMKM
jgi:hypothetical protein